MQLPLPSFEEHLSFCPWNLSLVNLWRLYAGNLRLWTRLCIWICVRVFEFALVYLNLRLCIAVCVCVLQFAFVYCNLRLCIAICVCVLQFAFVYYNLRLCIASCVCVLQVAFVYWNLRLPYCTFAPLWTSCLVPRFWPGWCCNYLIG